MILSLSNVAKDAKLATYKIELNGEELTLRPLEHSDAQALAHFLNSLSEETRRLSTFESYDLQAATAMADAINKYDKLRLIVESDKRIVGLIELSFGLPQGDVDRFSAAGIDLSEETDCRFGPTFTDDYQSRGLGSNVFPLVEDVVRKFGKTRIILWGGVLADNERAIRFYEKFGFSKAGKYTGSDGLTKFDMILTLHN